MKSTFTFLLWSIFNRFRFQICIYSPILYRTLYNIRSEIIPCDVTLPLLTEASFVDIVASLFWVFSFQNKVMKMGESNILVEGKQWSLKFYEEIQF